MGETLLAVIALLALFSFMAYVVADMIMYAPGQRRKAVAQHRTQRHSRSHYCATHKGKQ